MDDPTLLNRLRRIEDQLEILSREAGVPYDRPGADLPPSVSELALNGKMVQAVQELMKLTGVSMAVAKHRLDNL
jgi:hypothetical protein